MRSGHGADRADSLGRQSALQRRGSGAVASACRISVDSDRDGDGAGRGRRTARRRAGRQGLRRAQRQGPFLRAGSPLRHGVADRLLADSPRLFRAGPHRPVHDPAVADRRRPSGRRVFKLVDIAFAQRRKTSRNAFTEWAGSGNESANRLLAASIDPARRGETLSVDDFVRLLRRSGDLGRRRLRRPRRGAAARLGRARSLTADAAAIVSLRCPHLTATPPRSGCPLVRSPFGCPGKVNLYLAVGDRREDGYHELTTVFQAVSLVDEVTVRNADVLSLELIGEGADTAAHRRTQPRLAGRRADGRTRRARARRLDHGRQIHPGGRRNGAVAARTRRRCWSRMNSLWELSVPRRDLHVLAARLGSDVPFALHGGTALGPVAARSWPPCCPATPFTGCWRSPTAGCPPRRCSSSWTGSGSAGDPPRLDEPGPVLAALAAGDPEQLAPLLGNEMQAAAVSLDPALRGPCAPAWRPAHWRASCRAPVRRVRSCARRRPRRWTSAPSCRGRVSAARCGSPADRCTVPGWCRTPVTEA